MTSDATHAPAATTEITWEGPEALRPLLVSIDSIEALPGNPRRGDVEVVARSLERFGQMKPVTLNANGQVTAGNHTRAAALSLGWTHLAVVPTDQDEVLGAAWALADNRSSDLATYDDVDLASMLAAVQAQDASLLASAGFNDAEELAQLLAALEPPSEQLTDPDAVPDLPAEPITKPGDLWLLGRHRLGCVDAFDAVSVDAVLGGQVPGCIFTDPPYGMNLQTDYTKLGHGQGRHHEAVIGDDAPFDASSLIGRYADVAQQWWWGADYYHRTLPAGGSWVVWDKRSNQAEMDLDALFGASFELCWSRQRHQRAIARIVWAMTHGQERPEEDARRGLHPTQKPVALACWFFERWVPPASTVLDLFGGAGSSLIAAEQMGHRAVVTEISPAYCDVIVQRFEEFTGQKATRG